MVGSNDIGKARIYYDATFVALGGEPGETDERGRLIYRHNGGRLMVTTPINGQPATAANGGTIGILADSPDHVVAWYNAGVSNGGIAIESPPYERPDGTFVAFLRDPDGNKFSVRSLPKK